MLECLLSIFLHNKVRTSCSTTILPREDIIQHDLILGQASLEGSNLTNNMGKGDRHKLLADAQGNSGNTSNNSNEKKIMRKEIERQRRQHMSNLHASLLSLLPLESIKGKRSASDHINEAVNYIKYLENNIQELSFKRDQLKNISNLEAFDQGDSSSNNCLMKGVTINPYSGGLMIIISGGVVGEDLQLSRVLEALLEDGLDVVSFVSSQTVDGFFHTIQTESENIRWTMNSLEGVISASSNTQLKHIISRVDHVSMRVQNFPSAYICLPRLSFPHLTLRLKWLKDLYQGK